MTTTTIPRPETEALIEDVRWLVACGEIPENVARRTGRSIDGLAKALSRHAPDIAAPFNTAQGRARTQTPPHVLHDPSKPQHQEEGMTQQAEATRENATVADIVRALANGLSLQAVTEKSAQPYPEVARIAKDHGYPNRALLAIAADRLEKGEKVRTALAVPRVELAELFADAENVGLGSKAKRIRDLIVQLRDDIKEKSELANALADLRAAQAKVAALRGTKPKDTATSPAAAKAARKAIREWAAANGTPVTGSIIPKAVLAAYDEAMAA